jgi:hypothetical protein
MLQRWLPPIPATRTAAGARLPSLLSDGPVSLTIVWLGGNDRDLAVFWLGVLLSRIRLLRYAAVADQPSPAGACVSTVTHQH